MGTLGRRHRPCYIGLPRRVHGARPFAQETGQETGQGQEAEKEEQERAGHQKAQGGLRKGGQASGLSGPKPKTGRLKYPAIAQGVVRHERELSENVEEYLETIYRITLKAPMAKTGEIAEHLELSPPSVTEMTKRLQAKGYVEYAPYKGVRLTEKGRDHAYQLLRRHRVVQAFLEQVLGMEKEEAHEWGCKMEHVIPVELETYLYSKLPEKDLKGLEPPRTLEEAGLNPNEASAPGEEQNGTDNRRHRPS